jgi:beta-glucoside operon transcriptional antiterminator
VRIVKKIYNNNIVNAVDGDGEDVILVGAGVGYLTSKGTVVDESRVEREFHLTGQAKSGAFRVLLELPYPIIKAMTKVTAFLLETHGIALTPTVEVGLADHIAQVLKRMEDGLPIFNSMLWETKMTYPTEFGIALQIVDVIHEELGIKLPLDEAGFITLHLVNSGLVADPHQALALSGALHDIIAIVEVELNITVDGTTTATGRFLSHVKFVIQRITQNTTHQGSFDSVFRSLKAEDETIYQCAAKIGTYLDDRFAANVGQEEHMYLMLHLRRLKDEIESGTSNAK